MPGACEDRGMGLRELSPAEQLMQFKKKISNRDTLNVDEGAKLLHAIQDIEQRENSARKE